MRYMAKIFIAVVLISGFAFFVNSFGKSTGYVITEDSLD